MAHICVGNLIIIGSDNGLSPGRRQAIIWTNVRILLIGPLRTNFSEILSETHSFSFKKMHLKMSSAKWCPFVSASMCYLYIGNPYISKTVSLIHFYNKNVCVENLRDDRVNGANAAVTWFHENQMVDNPEKFQSIILPRNDGVSTPLSVQNNDLCPTNEITVLGVMLDDRLSFKSHVDDMCNRASRQMNSYQRFSKYLKIDRRLSVYKSFIQSNFSYCPVAWQIRHI